MPLYTCPMCGANVPDQAPTCVRCGQSTQGLQPAGGLQPMQAMAPRKGGGAGIVIAVVVALLILPVVGTFAVMAIYGVRKYIANAKTAEARNTVAHIAKAAVSAYEREDEAGGETVTHRLCRSASSAVPRDRSMVSARKYQSASSEWNVDADRNAGFACLRFEMPSPQYFQYEYVATATSFVVRAHGDLNGDGVFSTFELRGEVKDDRVVIAPSIVETNPED